MELGLLSLKLFVLDPHVTPMSLYERHIRAMATANSSSYQLKRSLEIPQKMKTLRHSTLRPYGSPSRSLRLEEDASPLQRTSSFVLTSVRPTQLNTQGATSLDTGYS